MWAVPKGEALFQIDSIPSFAKGVARGDLVRATPGEEGMQFQGIVQPSGHSTVRVAVKRPEDVRPARELLEQVGCSVETDGALWLVFVDVPPTLPLESLRRALEPGRKQRRWTYKELCVAGKTRRRKFKP